MKDQRVSLVCQRFGKLTVTKLAGTVKHGRNNINVWLCRCDCGNTLEVDQNSLRKGQVPACKTCRRAPCIVCGGEITNESYSVLRKTCSEECKKEHLRNKSLKRYKKLTFENPDHNKERWQIKKQKNPNLCQQRYQRELELRANKPIEVQQLEKQKRNKASIEWRKKWRQRVKETDPEAYRDFLLRNRRSGRKSYGKKQLAKILSVSQLLKSRKREQ